MFKISSIEIKGFWGQHVIQTDFKQNVNIIIGNNGTGKTTFMNILYAILSVDSEGLYENDFNEVTIRLTDNGKNKTIRATKQETGSSPFPVVMYYISNQKFVLPVISGDDRSYPLAHRRRSQEDSATIRSILSGLVHLASLSVYRLRHDPDAEMRGERNRRLLSPVDSRLHELRQRLTQYQLELSDEARKISIELQKNVLVSLLYSGEKTKNNYSIEFNEEQEKQSLVVAYRQLGLSGSDITSRIQRHIAGVKSTLKALEAREATANFAPIEARERTRDVIKLSLDAEKRTEEVFSQVNEFLKTIASFIPAKRFAFVGGELSPDSVISRVSFRDLSL